MPDETPDIEVISPEQESIVKKLETTLPPVVDERYIVEFEKGVENYKRWLAACLRATQPNHWINFGSLEKPSLYLQGPGVEALMGPLGMAYDEAPMQRKDAHTDPDGKQWYAVWTEGWIESKFLKRRGYFIGYCDSKDQFFSAKKSWNPEQGEADVRKSSMTNWLVNAVNRLAGLRNPSPEIMKMAGIPIEKIPRADMSGTRSLEQAEGAISEAQAKRLYAIFKQQHISEEAFRRKLLEIGAKDKDNKPSTYAVPRKAYDALVAWVEGGGQEPPRAPGEEG